MSGPCACGKMERSLGSLRNMDATLHLYSANAKGGWKDGIFQRGHRVILGPGLDAAGLLPSIICALRCRVKAPNVYVVHSST